MLNPLRPELALVMHRERVAEGLRRARLTSGRSPSPRRRARRRLQLRLRMA
jgi:hypothetical protein